MASKYFKKSGFTLIELLIVIAIIGILSTIVLGSLAESRKKAQITHDKVNLRQFKDLMIATQLELGTPLIVAYSSVPNINWQWVYQPCANYLSANVNNNLKNISDTDECYTDWLDALTAIATKSNSTLSVSSLKLFSRDSWGSPFLLDLNEGEWGNNPGAGGLTTFEENCKPDVIFSAGPNGRTDNPQLNFDLVTHTWHLVFSGDDFGTTITTSNGTCPTPVVDYI